jgi:cation:H+ antiporter
VPLATVTSLPERVAVISAVRLRAVDSAVGNLLGSNAFTVFALATEDLVYTSGTLRAIHASCALAGLLAMRLTTLGLIGTLARVERRIWIVEVDAFLLILCYGLGMALLYLRGIGAGRGSGVKGRVHLCVGACRRAGDSSTG